MCELDRRRVAAAVANVIDNAVKYGGGPTRIEVAPCDDGGVRVTVDDAGPGIPVAERARVMGRFTRGSAGRAAGATAGSGLGLALCEAHVQAHGARWSSPTPRVAAPDSC